jgi:thioredoxin reductase (NADPH)
VEKPGILVVDDDQSVLNALGRDMTRAFGDEYRILRAHSGGAALETLQQLKLRGGQVALLLVDQRMPEMTGVEFLARAAGIFPDAKRVLLTAYADTEAAIRAINEVRLDFYLTKPWQPPEERLYPVLNDLLDAWHAMVPRPSDSIRLIGHRWSAASHQIRDYLARNLVPYTWSDIEADRDARHLVELAGVDASQLPLVLFPDGTHLAKPAIPAIAERLGLRMHAEQPFYDLVIVGAGPAGLAAAVYGASEGLRTLLIEREAPGGQAGMSSRIENYLGFPVGLSGSDLARRAVAQATRFGAELLTPQEVVGVRLQDNYRVIKLADGSEISCQALLIATGVSYRKLNVPGADRLAGAGVFYGAAITEALEYRDRDVFIVGAGNSAGQAAVHLAQYARSVTILVRGESLDESMSQYLIAQLGETPNIAVRSRTTVQEALGETHLESLRLEDTRAGEHSTVAADALFIFIGAMPRTEWVAGLVERDNHGFIPTGLDVMREGQPPHGWPLERDPFWLESSVPGIFVAGDVRHGSIKRIASATGEGAMAVQFVHQHLSSPAPRRSINTAAASHAELLRNSPVFANLADRDLLLLAEFAQPIEVPAGQLVMEEGKKGDTLYVVIDGELEVSTVRGGHETQLAVLGRGEVVGEMAVLQEVPRTASVRALRDSRLLVITQAAFLNMLMKNAAALRQILRTVSTRIRDTEAIVMQQAKMAALGTLAAGLAHQLNNPSSAVLSSAARLREVLTEWESAGREMVQLNLDSDQQARLQALRQEAEQHPAALNLSDPLARSEKEERLQSWLEQHAVARAHLVAEPLVSAGWDDVTLEELSLGLRPTDLPAISRWLAATATASQSLREIAAGANAISDVVQAVKHYTHLDQAPIQEIDVRQSLDNTLLIMKHRLTPGVRVVRDYAPDLPQITTYGSEINQVWTNLLENAIDAVEGKGEVVVRAYGQNGHVVVEVRDNGPGILPQIQSRVFEPFFTTKPLGHGTGLGLHIARTIVVDRAQGQIKVNSQPGETCFQVTLPIRMEHRPKSPEKAQEPPESKPSPQTPRPASRRAAA